MVVSQEEVKKTYITPKLIVHGTIGEITKATGGNPLYEDGYWDVGQKKFVSDGTTGSDYT